MIITVGVTVGFEEPAPDPAFAGRVGLFLPALENAGDGLESQLPRFRAVQMQPLFVAALLKGTARDSAHSLKYAVLQGGCTPRRPEVNGDKRGLESQAIKADQHIATPAAVRGLAPCLHAFIVE